MADVTPDQQAGNLVLLRRTSEGAEGRFDRTYGSFMAMRRSGETYDSPRRGPARDRTTARARTSTLDATRPWEHSVVWFLAHFHPSPWHLIRAVWQGHQQTTHYDLHIRGRRLMVRNR